MRDRAHHENSAAKPQLKKNGRKEHKGRKRESVVKIAGVETNPKLQG